MVKITSVTIFRHTICLKIPAENNFVLMPPHRVEVSPICQTSLNGQTTLSPSLSSDFRTCDLSCISCAQF